MRRHVIWFWETRLIAGKTLLCANCMNTKQCHKRNSALRSMEQQSHSCMALHKSFSGFVKQLVPSSSRRTHTHTQISIENLIILYYELMTNDRHVPESQSNISAVNILMLQLGFIKITLTCAKPIWQTFRTFSHAN